MEEKEHPRLTADSSVGKAARVTSALAWLCAQTGCCRYKDLVNKTYEIHAYKFAVNVLDNDPGNEFPGWPITIQQAENKGKNKLT